MHYLRRFYHVMKTISNLEHSDLGKMLTIFYGNDGVEFVDSILKELPPVNTILEDRLSVENRTNFHIDLEVRILL